MRDETAQIDEGIRDAFSDEGIVLQWHLTVEIQSSTGRGRYLAHRSADVNSEEPQIWAIIGLLEGSLVAARMQLEAWTADPDSTFNEDEDEEPRE